MQLPPSPYFSHLAIQCEDIDATVDTLIDLWSPLGIKSWKTIDYTPEGDELHQGDTFTIQSSLTMLTPVVEMNVIEPITGPWFAQSYMSKRGDSIEHLAWGVEDFDEKIEKFKDFGYYNVSCAGYENRRWVQLRNVWMPGGMGIELLEPGMHGPITEMLREVDPDAVEGPPQSVSEISQIGGMVFDLDRTLDDLREPLALLDVGPWQIEEFAPGSNDLNVGAPFSMRTARARLSPQIELVFHEPAEGESRLFEYLRDKGEGIAYMAFTVPGYDEALSSLEGKGSQVFAAGEQDGKRWSYLDTADRPGGILMKLLEPGLGGLV